MKRLFINARVVNPFGEHEFIERGYLLIDGETIAEVGDGSPENIGADDVIDLEGKVVLPGMINAHTHLYSSLALGMPPPAISPTNFLEILERVWWQLDLALDESSARASFQAGLLACLRAGVTTVFDHHSSQNFIPGSLDLLVDAAREVGVNISTAFEITDRNGAHRFEAGLNENIATLKKYADDPTVHPMVGLHASFTLSDESLKAIRTSLDSVPDWGIHIHVSEDKADEADARNRGYDSVIQRLASFDLINERSMIIHGLHITVADLSLLDDLGANHVHNPTSNANNRVGLLPTDTIEQLKSGLGTDGMQMNMLREAKEGTLIRSAQPLSVNQVDYVKLLFGHNPKLASHLFGTKLGRLQPGYRADMAVYDYLPRTKLNAGNLTGHLLFGLDLPRHVIAGGRFRIRDNNFVDIDEGKILEHAQEQSMLLWAAIDNMRKA